ncbi:uncharacterized protein HaLaN_21013 [Haematococcus lacustris]|uniref:Cathepsin propeptide inhibitor domain-containing protein n=1 Tax=Haematococcus lacustris TaxID=44745 RepID=A0A699ZN71_HAELA|nr:uncharacterized protein HaLaN_21013 [Haematococcus lacustris]
MPHKYPRPGPDPRGRGQLPSSTVDLGCLDTSPREDPSAFFSWAHRHNRPYMIGAPRHYLLAANLHPAVSKQLGSATPQHLELVQQTYATRQQVWLDNARYALQYNAANGASGHWLGLNGLADLSYNEYRGLLGTRVKARQHATQLSASGSGRVPGFMYDHVDLAGLPRSVDWRNASAVTPVKNQGMRAGEGQMRGQVRGGKG